MNETPFDKTMLDLLERLRGAVQKRNEAEAQIADITGAVRGLAKVSEDAEARDSYLEKLEELVMKPGFVDTVRSILSVHGGLTPTQIMSWIRIGGSMNLSSYSNPMACIHTTLRRMKESGKVEEFENEAKEKAYRLVSHPRRRGFRFPRNVSPTESK